MFNENSEEALRTEMRVWERFPALKHFMQSCLDENVINSPKTFSVKPKNIFLYHLEANIKANN